MDNTTLNILYESTSALVPYARNSNTHTDAQIQEIANSIKQFGFLNPVLVAGGTIIAGHGRVMAALILGLETVPCIDISHLTEVQQRAYVIADNQLAKKSAFDMDILVSELEELANLNFDISLVGFDFTEIDNLLSNDFLPKEQPPTQYPGVTKPLPPGYEKNNPGALVERFGIPPFSIFDTRQGYWQNRKKSWLSIIGDTSTSKEGTLGNETIISLINNGSSGFDPVLAETIYNWFLPANGGTILDPFGGEQTKGFVAGYLGFGYSAVEYRQEQVDINRAIVAGMKNIKYCCGDSNFITTLVGGGKYDLVFTSPLYYYLEVYSADDMSALGSYSEFMAQYKNIFTQCVEMLNDNRFLVVKVGEIRDKKTGVYRNFVGDNIQIFIDLGLSFYNSIVLINPVGTAAVRAQRTFVNRKVVALHQNILVFYKGDVNKIQDHFNEINMLDFEDGY